MVQRAATTVLVALSVSGLVQQASFAASERTTALVTITERDEVKSAPGYDDLMHRYIDEQGGCEELVRQLR